ncbi:Mitochondrial inner membrane protease atp23 [Diplodia seriata]|uniref:Mitochondrial inner membrane protease ATP23 n=1 Tax=Diplodia seriata TaxID=420778 RepID=A0A1S8BI37_9PEZI|nr:Mitochondrial inner membrane protease ATP23 [Diplodia seriata]
MDPETKPAAAVPRPPTSTTDQPDPSFYNWRTFFSILSGQATPDERRQYFLNRDTLREDRDIARVEAHRDWAFQYSPVVRFMRDEVQKLGGDVGPHNVRCRRCTTAQGGGFDIDYGVLLCANHMRNRGHVEDTIAHEMVHAYDYLRFKVDRWNLRHQACTEIRASTLSGECRFTREFFTRNQWRFTSQLQDCVRRRATLSLMARPAVKDDVHAARLVNEVWDSCFLDTRPFDEIYR